MNTRDIRTIALILTLGIALALLVPTAAAVTPDTGYSLDIANAIHVSTDGSTYLISPDTSSTIPVKITIPTGETVRAYNVSAVFSGGNTHLLLTEKTSSAGTDWIKAENQPNIAITSISSTGITGTKPLFDITLKNPETLTAGETYTLDIHVETAYNQSSAIIKREWTETISIRLAEKSRDDKPSQMMTTIIQTFTPTNPTPTEPLPSPGANGGTERILVILDTATALRSHDIVVEIGYSDLVIIGSLLVTGDTQYTDTEFVTIPNKTAGIKNAHYLYPLEKGTSTDKLLGADGQPLERKSFWYIFRIDARLLGGDVETITFRVPLNILEAHGYTYGDVILYNGNDETREWTPLDTYLISLEGGYAYYRAYTDGVSPFGILFDEDMTIIPEEFDADDPTTWEPLPTPGCPLLPLILILVIVFGIFLVVWIRKKKKSTSDDEDS